MFEKSVMTSPPCDCATSPACLLTVSSKPPVSRGFAHRAATWLDYRQNADEVDMMVGWMLMLMRAVQMILLMTPSGEMT